MAAEPERLTCVLTIDCDHLGERTASAAYILTLKVSYDCRPAPQHVMSWHLGQIGRGAARVAGTPMTVAYGPADHAYEVAASAEGPVGRGGRSRPIASFGLFHAITVDRKGLRLARKVSIWSYVTVSVTFCCPAEGLERAFSGRNPRKIGHRTSN